MKNIITDRCPLCENPGADFYRNDKQWYYRCDNCFGIFLDKTQRPGREAEMARYREHNNDIDDEKYQKFVSPISSAILRDFSQVDKGLDFGAGTGPVISRVLKDNQFLIEQYDPLFHDYPDLLDKKYDYIACCEVVEHFHEPYREFKLLKKLLLPRGKIYCMTELYDENMDFSKWYYKNDPTHVFFYQKKTIRWIKEEFGFRDVTIEGRLITWENQL